MVSFHLETYQDLNESISSFLQQRDLQEKIKKVRLSEDESECDQHSGPLNARPSFFLLFQVGLFENFSAVDKKTSSS